MAYMLDTNICIYIIKHHPEAVRRRFVAHSLADICLSAVTLAELMYGVQRSNRPQQSRDALNAFAGHLEILPFDDLAADHCGDIRAGLQRSGEVIGSMDMLIAAHARSRALTLVTNNLREFERVPGLLLDNWVED